jgi:hypothetical protein
MNGTDSAEEHLELYDSLDIDNQVHRRAQIYALEDFYSKIISSKGPEYLNIGEDVKSQGVDVQWGKCRSRLQSLTGISTPDEYEKAINNLDEIRDNIAHNCDEYPPKEKTSQIREVAEEWRMWFTEKCEEYEEKEGEMSARKTMIHLVEQAISDIEGTPMPQHEPFKSKVKESKSQVDEFRQRLEELGDGDEITRELVYLFSDVKDASQISERAVEGDNHVDWALGELGEPGVTSEELGLDS